MDKQPLPPVESLSFGIYPPSAYPPPSFFESSTRLHPALVIPAKRTGEVQKLLKDVMFNETKRKSVYALEKGIDYEESDVAGSYDPNKERKLVLLRQGDCTDDTAIIDDVVFQDETVKSLIESSASKTESTTAPEGKNEIRKSYINMPASPYHLLTVDQVLRRLLPIDTDTADNSANKVEEVPSSFEIAGHLAHVNLRSESLPYKYLIGKAIIDKNPRIKVVVNKVGNIENEFRTFPMEILAGEGLDVDLLNKLCNGELAEDASSKFTINKNAEPGMQIQLKIGKEHQSLMEVQLKEHGCRFKLDFASVYWNSRLQGEHGRLVQYIVQSAESKQKCTNKDEKKQCIVADAMAGVGPFAVPLTSSNAPHYHKTPIICHANDLNPVSYKYLQMNAKLNRCFADRLETYNLDAREFIHKMNADHIQVDHFIMNLPQLAPEFLDAFRGWKFDENSDRPMVHVHCFDEKARTPEDTARIEKNTLQRCERALGCLGCFTDADTNEAEVRVIRDVGPRKNMLCVSFRLPREMESVDKLVLGDSNITEKRPRDVTSDEECFLKRTKES
jgi:tRNA (guanine37-N1)-methyltransferase